VVEGNKELQKALQYQGGSGRIFAGIFITFTVILWAWDWWNTKYYY
jgi:hypothetical protein